MGLLKNQELQRLTTASLSNLFRSGSPSASASASSIRGATSPQEALHLYKTRIQRKHQGDEDPFDTHAVVFTIKACSRLSDSLLISHLHAHLLKTNLRSHVYVATALLHGYVRSSFQDACLLYDEIPNRNIVTENTMITCYSKYGDLNTARSLFDGMPTRDIASWSAMISGYMDKGNWTQGLALFRELMRCWEVKPDQLTLVTLLSGCTHTGSLRLLGKSIHAYSEKNGLELSVPLGTALIDMYAKSGCLRSAFRVFERMPERSVGPWTAMICGLALHGHGDDAIAFFEHMKKAGVEPNEITFTGVLNACCHAGLLEEGQRNFSSMVEEFGFEPSIHHYGCMVDLFAKAGMLEDAYLIIKKMKMEPNIIVLTSLLAACKKHKNFEVAEKVMDRVLQMINPDEHGGVYTLISDLYALGGKWNDVEQIRKLMDRRNVKKNRGSSFIEVEELRHSMLSIC